jgi:hypothetical protein
MNGATDVGTLSRTVPNGVPRKALRSSSFLDLAKGGLEIGQKPLARVGQRYAPCGAAQESHADSVLKAAYRVAYG